MSSPRFTPGGSAGGPSREGSSPDEATYGVSSDHLGEASDVSSRSKVWEEMGDDARTKAEYDLNNELFLLLETRGYLETTIDVAWVGRFLEALTPIILLREKGLKCLLDALLEGDFHLEAGSSSLPTDLFFSKSLFIPQRSLDKVTGNIEIKGAPGRDGYVIRRKS